MLNLTLNLIILFIAAVFVVLVHEMSKYYISLTLLHPIHRKRMDVKVNPLKYIDPIGVIMFMFSYVGWQKPGEYNPTRFKDKERALIVLSITGILANLLVMIALIPLFLSLKDTNSYVINQVATLVYYIIRFSFAIIIVNLLPMPPLDVTKIIYAANPSFYFKMLQNERIIQAVFILLIAFGVLSGFVEALFNPIYQFLI